MEPTTILRARDPKGIREVARALGVTTAALAKQVGLSDQRIWKLYSGDLVGVAADKAIAISEALGRPVAELFEFPDAAELKKLKLL
jgi:transcriptional regulator with XRE-family HTH domain